MCKTLQKVFECAVIQYGLWRSLWFLLNILWAFQHLINDENLLSEGIHIITLILSEVFDHYDFLHFL